MPISTTASHIFSSPVTNSRGNTQRPAPIIVTLRAKLTLWPVWLSFDDTQPPRMLPASDRRYMMIIGRNMILRSTSYVVRQYLGKIGREWCRARVCHYGEIEA